MSGIEILGLAASVIQIAELGGKLSVQLFTFTRKVKSANKSIDALSQELASTGAVLKQLGETLTKDEHVRVCSQEAISTARGLVDDTNRVFTNLQKVVEGDEKSNEKFLKGISFKQRLKFPFLESQIEQVQANLERLKSSLLVILNVLIFAEQLRNQEALPILKDQRELIKILASEKDENERRYQRILAAITDRPNQDGTNRSADLSASSDGRITPILYPLSTASTMINPDPKSPTPGPTTQQPAKIIMLPSIALPTALQRHHERIHHHSYLVQNLLSEIASLQYNLDLSTRDRMQNNILNLHWEEWSTYRLRHGHEHFEKMLGVHPDVASYWTDRLQDHFARQLEAAEAFRRRKSRISSVSSITSSPEQRTRTVSTERKTKADSSLVDTAHSRLVSVANPSSDIDEVDAEAAAGLAAMAADSQTSSSEALATTLRSQSSPLYRGEAPSVVSDNDGPDHENLSMSNGGRYGPVWTKRGSDLGDDGPEAEVAQALRSRETSIARVPEIMPLKGGEDASMVEFVIALYDYQPEADDHGELAFKAGDKIEVIESVYGYWWRGTCANNTGMFHTNYVGVPANPRKPQVISQEINNHSEESTPLLQAAVNAERVDRHTLARLGAQGECLHYTDQNLDIGHNAAVGVEDKNKELRRLSRSMFAVDVDNPSTAREQQIREEEEDLQKVDSKQSVFSANAEGFDNSKRGSQVSVDSFKPRDPKRNAVSMLIEPTSATGLDLRSQLHEHSASVDAAMTSQYLLSTDLGISTASPQQSSPAHGRLFYSDEPSAHGEPQSDAFVVLPRSTPASSPQHHPAQPPSLTSEAPQLSQSPEKASSANAFYTKARIRYISPEALEWAKRPWLYDPIDKDYLIIKQSLSRPELDLLSHQTQVLRNTRGDNIGAAKVSNEGDIGSLKLKNVFVVIPAPLYARFSGILEHETCDAKRGDEKNPLFVHFVYEGARKGLLSKGKKKSVFYKSTNIEVSAQQPPGQQQNVVQRRPVQYSARFSAPDMSLIPFIEQRGDDIEAEAKDRKRSFLKWRTSKPSDARVDSNASPVIAAPLSMSHAENEAPPRWKEPRPQELAFNSKVTWNSSANVIEGKVEGTKMTDELAARLVQHRLQSQRQTQQEQQKRSNVPNQAPLRTSMKQDNPQTYVQLSRTQSAAHTAMWPGVPSPSESYPRPLYLSTRAETSSSSQSPLSPEDRYNIYAPYSPSSSAQSSADQSTRFSPYQGAANYEQPIYEAISPANSIPISPLLSAKPSTYRQQQNSNHPGPSNIGSTPEYSVTIPQKVALADRAKYQFEVDSEDEVIEDEIDANTGELSGAVKRLDLLSRAMGDEVEAQNRKLLAIVDRSDRPEGKISLNKQKLNRIDGRGQNPAQALGIESGLSSSPLATALDLTAPGEETKKPAVSPEIAEKLVQLRTYTEEWDTHEKEEVARTDEVTKQKTHREAALAAASEKGRRRDKDRGEWSHAEQEDIEEAETSTAEARAELEPAFQASERLPRQSPTSSQGSATSHSQKQKQNAVFKVGDSGFVSMHLQPVTENKTDLDDIDKLILQFSSLDEGEYVERYKSVA